MLSQMQRLQLASRPIAGPQSVPSPFGGWNTRDALDGMPAEDAVVLDNWYPDVGGVVSRNGYALFASQVGVAPVRTLAVYDSAAKTALLACASGHIYDISDGTPDNLRAHLSSDIWQTVNFLNHLFFFNGRDVPRIYDGTNVSLTNFTAISDPSVLYSAWVYQQRLFAMEAQASGFWYLPINSFSGDMVFYDLSVFTPRGGHLVAITSMSHDGGNGVQDMIVFIMSSGDCLIFFGNDPSLADAWQLIGVYHLSPPVGPRAVCNYGAEAYVTTFDDHVPMQQQLVALKVGQLPPRSKVSNAVQAAVRANKNAFGWQALYYPAGRRVIYNVPNPNGTFVQHVQNTSNSAFCRFTGMNAYCWAVYKDALYFGGADGKVYKADIGGMDDDAPITATGQQAWNVFSAPVRKRVTAVRPVIQVKTSITYKFGLGFDYGAIGPVVQGSIASNGTPWDVSPWDTSPWSPEIQVDSSWHIGGGTGQSVGCELKVSSNQPVSWLRTDYRMERGANL